MKKKSLSSRWAECPFFVSIRAVHGVLWLLCFLIVLMIVLGVCYPLRLSIPVKMEGDKLFVSQTLVQAIPKTTQLTLLEGSRFFSVYVSQRGLDENNRFYLTISVDREAYLESQFDRAKDYRLLIRTTTLYKLLIERKSRSENDQV